MGPEGTVGDVSCFPVGLQTSVLGEGGLHIGVYTKGGAWRPGCLGLNGEGAGDLNAGPEGKRGGIGDENGVGLEDRDGIGLRMGWVWDEVKTADGLCALICPAPHA